MRPSLSVVIICYNEARRIRPCLESVAGWADEIVVLDSCSTDETVQIVHEFTAKVFIQDLCSPNRPGGYSDARNYAISQATGDWIFIIDADERATPHVRSEIDAAISIGDGPEIFEISRVEVYSGIQLDYVYDKPWLARLFKAGKAQFHGRPVHESLVGSGVTRRLNHPLQHYSKESLHQFLETQNRYTTLEVSGGPGGKPASATKAVLLALHQFLYRYVHLRGYRDGTMGFIISASLAGYTFEVWAKSWEAAYNRKEVDRGQAGPVARAGLETVGSIWRGAGGLKRLFVRSESNRPWETSTPSSGSDKKHEESLSQR